MVKTKGDLINVPLPQFVCRLVRELWLFACQNLNKIVQQYEQSKHRRTGIVEQTIQICENVYSKDWRRVLKRG